MVALRFWMGRLKKMDLTIVEILLVNIYVIELVRFVFMVYAKFKPFFVSRLKNAKVKDIKEGDE